MQRFGERIVNSFGMEIRPWMPKLWIAALSVKSLTLTGEVATSFAIYSDNPRIVSYIDPI